MEILLIIATLLGGFAAVWFFWDRLKGRNRRAGRRPGPGLRTENDIAEIYKKLQAGAATPVGNVDLIQRLSQGPEDISGKYLEEIIDGGEFYSAAEIQAARFALQDISGGVQCKDLNNRVVENDPTRELAQQTLGEARVSALAGTVFWERPGSENRKKAFDKLIELIK